MTTDYGQTIHLPQTDFPRRAGLAEKEPRLLERWRSMDLYARQRAESKGRKKFILHFGPPFANGHIHIGHVLSQTLKDVICRAYQMMGYDAPLVGGYDCHGLPIEWKIEEKYRAADKNFRKENMDPAAFRAECRAYAAHWSDVQTGELARIGILADWKNPYSTMHKASEATIAAEVHKFLKNGSLYRGSKPVMWSVPEQTALAEAEVEYKDHVSDVVWVKFPVVSGPAAIKDAAVVIWTTTPWTLPANRALAYGPELEYRVITVETTTETSLLTAGARLICAAALVPALQKSAGIQSYREEAVLTGADLAGTICAHPLRGQGYDFDVPMIPGDFVTTEAGTGFVHIAPGHGEDDYLAVLAYNRAHPKNPIEIPETVGPDGTYYAHVPLFAGLPVYLNDGRRGPANKRVAEAILQAGRLAAKIYAGEKGEYRHSYPHSWRSKAPVIFRNTPQWFISMDKTGLRDKAMAAIKATRFTPASGANRLSAMVEQRGDWNISRQRAWGVPLAFFIDKETNEPLRDEEVLNRTIRIFREEGSDAWFSRPAADFLGPAHDPARYEQVRDIIDVWFESGATQGFVLEDRPELGRPADLYLEGSDQHRGWFQSSLLVGCGTRGDAPYKGILTHGFILDEKGAKQSKSQGNVTDPMKLCDIHGADILRLWVAGSDYTNDIRFGEKVLQGHTETYRRLRGTFCYLLGSIDDTVRLPLEKLSGLDRFILHRLHAVDAEVRACIESYDLQQMVSTVHNFCARDLSSLYFDICKDTLYCESKLSEKRQAVVTVLDHVFRHLVHWLAPVLPFTAEEAWLSYHGLPMDDTQTSIHLSQMPAAPAEWQNAVLAETFARIIAARAVVTGALELRRAAKEIGASLETAPVVHVADPATMAALASSPFADICITSSLRLTDAPAPEGAFVLPESPGIAVVVEKAAGAKCPRCWKYATDIGTDTQHPEICGRCSSVIQITARAAA